MNMMVMNFINEKLIMLNMPTSDYFHDELFYKLRRLFLAFFICVREMIKLLVSGITNGISELAPVNSIIILYFVD